MDWEAPTHPLAMREPRHGRRLTLAGVVHTNQGPLLLYTAHLEVRRRERLEGVCEGRGAGSRSRLEEGRLRPGRRLNVAGMVHTNQGPLLLFTARLEGAEGLVGAGRGGEG